MKNTNKIIKGTAALIFAALMVTSFGGCAKSESSSATGGNTSSSAVAESSNTEQPTSVSTSTVQRIESKDDDFDIGYAEGETTNKVYGYEGTDANVYNIPAEHDGTKVTSISFNAFKQDPVIEVNIPDTITSIGETAFYRCASLEKVTMGSGVETIDKGAFLECTALKELVLSDSLKEINIGTFQSCSSLEKVTIPNNVTKIYGIAFAECTSLKEVHMGNSVTEIVDKDDEDANVFIDCSADLTIYAPAGSYAEDYAKSRNYKFVAE